MTSATDGDTAEEKLSGSSEPFPTKTTGAEEQSGGPMSCPCSIFDVREEQVLEPSGALRIRLICNVCGSLIDSKLVEEGDPDPTRARGGDARSAEGDGVAVETGG